MKWPALLLALCSLLSVPALARPPSSSRTDIRSVPRYELTVTLFPSEHRLLGSVVIDLPASPSIRQQVGFQLSATMGELTAEVREPPECAGPAAVTRTAAGTGPGDRWEVKPKVPFSASKQIRLQIRYAGGTQQGNQFYLGPEGCFAGMPGTAWYPHFEGLGVGSLRFTVPADYVVRATGSQSRTSRASAATTFDFTVTQPSLFSFAAAPYRVHRYEGRVPVTLYLLRDRPFAAAMAAHCQRVLEVLQQEFGPYPYGEFAVVETPGPQSLRSGFSGASYEGFIFAASDLLTPGFNLAFFGHEIGHQWWGILVRHRGNTGNYMLDEALAQYGSLRCVEVIEGPAAAERYRRVGYPNYAPLQCSFGGLLMAAVGLDQPLGQLRAPEVSSHFLANSKGFLVYHWLAKTVGREKFRSALHRLTRAHAFGAITWEEFLHQVEQSSGRKLGWFYDQWFNRSGVPQWSLEWAQERRWLRCTIRQAVPAYRATVPLLIQFEDGTGTLRPVELKGEETRVQWSVHRRVRAVQLDPYEDVYHATPARSAEAAGLRYWTQAIMLRAQNKVEQAIEMFQEGLKHLPAEDLYGVEFLLRSELGSMYRQTGRLVEAKRELELALACPVRWPEYLPDSLPQVYLGLAQIAKAQDDRQRMAWALHHLKSAQRKLGYATDAVREAADLEASGVQQQQ
jgi:tetratricopeptide (TPR) repeat protein